MASLILFSDVISFSALMIICLAILSGIITIPSSSPISLFLFPLMPWDYLKKVYDLCKNSAHYYEQLSKDLIDKTLGEYSTSSLRAPLHENN